MEHTPRHSVSVAGAIFNDASTHVLLIKRRDNDTWEPPGGVLELDETVEDGLRREVREETGAEIDVIKLTGVYKNMTRGIVALVFRCKARTSPDASTPEASKVAWIALDDVKNHLTPAYAIRILDAADPSTVSVRAHDGTRLLDPAYPR